MRRASRTACSTPCSQWACGVAWWRCAPARCRCRPSPGSCCLPPVPRASSTRPSRASGSWWGTSSATTRSAPGGTASSPRCGGWGCSGCRGACTTPGATAISRGSSPTPTTRKTKRRPCSTGTTGRGATCATGPMPWAAPGCCRCSSPASPAHAAGAGCAGWWSASCSPSSSSTPTTAACGRSSPTGPGICRPPTGGTTSASVPAASWRCSLPSCWWAAPTCPA